MDNDDFFGGARREQEPIATLQAHVGYTFRPGLWLAADATYYAGGQSTINRPPEGGPSGKHQVWTDVLPSCRPGPFSEVELVPQAKERIEPASPPLTLVANSLRPHAAF